MKTHATLAVLLSAVMSPLPCKALDSQASKSPAATAAGETCVLRNKQLERFSGGFGSNIPHDAYDSATPEGEQLQKAKAGSCRTDQLKVQRLYDLFSWKSFLAVNWPVGPVQDSSGVAEPLKSFTDKTGTPQWATWMEAREVFKPDGSKPAPWARRGPKKVRVLTDDQQAFVNASLWDQDGAPVYYEFLLNRFEYDYITNNTLYNQEGQTAYLKQGLTVLFGPGAIPTPTRPIANIGPIEMKLAWKVLGKGDLRERFFKMAAHIPDGAGGMKTAEVGLVGMHISHKTTSSSRWVWSTFEHVDNVQVNDLEVLEVEARHGRQLKPTFHDSTCATCPVNEPPSPDASGKRRTQVTRVIPIPDVIADLNREVQRHLRDMGSEWQYYELVGTQYITNASVGPTPEQQGVESITNHSGGAPTPAYLANTVLETYLQKGNQDSTGVSPDKSTRVFETSSCMGCHFDAGLLMQSNGTAVNMPGTADFSWLFSMARSTQARQPKLLYRHSPLKD